MYPLGYQDPEFRIQRRDKPPGRRQAALATSFYRVPERGLVLGDKLLQRYRALAWAPAGQPVSPNQLPQRHPSSPHAVSLRARRLGPQQGFLFPQGGTLPRWAHRP